MKSRSGAHRIIRTMIGAAINITMCSSVISSPAFWIDSDWRCTFVSSLSVRSLCCDPGFCANPSVLRTRACNHLCGGRRCNESRCSRRPVALEAMPAKHRPPLRWLERHRRLDSARRAFGARLRARKTSRRRPGTSLQTGASPHGLAWLAALRVVQKLLVVEEKLLTGGKHKLCAAIDALQNAICKFHGRLPQRRETFRNRPKTHIDSAGPVSLSFVRLSTQGPGPRKSAAAIWEGPSARADRLSCTTPRSGRWGKMKPRTTTVISIVCESVYVARQFFGGTRRDEPSQSCYCLLND